MFDTFRTGDLVAGFVAAAVFVVLFAILGLTPIASVPLAVVAYLGVRLAIPRPDENVSAIRECQRQVDDITGLIRTFDSGRHGGGSDLLHQIGAALVAILAAIRSDPKKREYASAFLDDYLTPIRAVVNPYVRLASQDVTLANPDLTETENDTFPKIVAELTKLREDLYRSDVTQLRTGKELVDLISLPIVTSHKDD